MSAAALGEVTARRVVTGRLATRVLFAGPTEGEPVLFLHGNLGSATWWEEVMVSLPSTLRAVAPDQRGYGEADPAARIDATRGLGDLADDAVALLDHLGIERAHVVGCSMGGSVVWRLLADHPARVRSATLVAPGSPFGFGATRDERGTPCWPDFAGSGAGLVPGELVRRLARGERGAEHPLDPRAVLRRQAWNGAAPAREEALLTAALQVHLGEDAYPGDVARSPHWPFFAPGRWGANNALSPRYAGKVERILRPGPKPPVLWVRGDRDPVVSDAAASDPATLGERGLLPGWPGREIYPPQPMLAQTRHLLRRYGAAGGGWREAVMRECGHTPFLERPGEFLVLLLGHLGAA